MSSITCIHIIPRGIYAHIALGTNAMCILVVPYQVCAYMSAAHPPILIALSLNHHSDCMASVSGEFSLQSYPPTATMQGLSVNLPFFSMEQKSVFPEPSLALGGWRRTFQAVKIFPILSHGEAELRERNGNGQSNHLPTINTMQWTKYKKWQEYSWLVCLDQNQLGKQETKWLSSSPIAT